MYFSLQDKEEYFLMKENLRTDISMHLFLCKMVSTMSVIYVWTV